MDSHKEKEVDSSEPAQTKPDTSHLAGSAKHSKKNHKKLIIILVAVVVVVAGLVASDLYYRKVRDDQKVAAAAVAAKAASAKEQTPEQQIVSKLSDSVKKQIDILKQDDSAVKSAIQNSTTAAEQVGGNIDESSLK